MGLYALTFCHLSSIKSYFSALPRLKGHFGEEIQTQNFNIHNIKEAIIQTQTFFIFSMTEKTNCENKVPRTLFDARKVAGSATYKNRVKQSEIVLSFKVS